jgi:hypothetical protein
MSQRSRTKPRAASEGSAAQRGVDDTEAQFARWAMEVVRSLRAARSARSFSAALGFKSDVVSRWENGTRDVLAAEVLRAMSVDGHSPWERLRRFDALLADAASRHGGSEHERVACFLRGLCEHRSTAWLASALGLSGRSADRILSGEFNVRFSTLLWMVEVVSGRAVEFVIVLLGDQLSATLLEWTQQHRARVRLSTDRPLTEAVIALMSIDAWKGRRSEDCQWLAERLMVSTDDVRATLDDLVAAGLVERSGDRHGVATRRAVNLRIDRDVENTTRFWYREGARRLESEPAPRLGWLVFNTSQANCRRVYAVLRNAYREISEIARQECANERAMLLSLGLFSLDGAPLDVVPGGE